MIDGTNSGGAALPGVGPEVFALTDEQIVGLDETQTPPSDEGPALAKVDSPRADKTTTSIDAHDPRPETKSAQPPKSASVAPPWLAERMNDPWHGDEARELWDGLQRVEHEAASYRQAFATPEDARALKDLYPGGVAEAKSAAESARQLSEIDGAFFRGDATARLHLAQKMMQQDPAAFREMVAAAVRLLEDSSRSADNKQAASIAPTPSANVAGAENTQAHQKQIDPATASAYASFERAANADLEKSVGVTIERTLEKALPNLRRIAPATDGLPLTQRLASAVRDEVDAALKSDAQLGEQIARVLAGRRFDDPARAQVVRLIDARAQQLVPGAVRRVVGTWTQTTLASRRGQAANDSQGREAAVNATPTVANAKDHSPGTAQPADRSDPKMRNARDLSPRKLAARAARVDYGRLSDEQILDL